MFDMLIRLAEQRLRVLLASRFCAEPLPWPDYNPARAADEHRYTPTLRLDTAFFLSSFRLKDEHGVEA